MILRKYNTLLAAGTAGSDLVRLSIFKTSTGTFATGSDWSPAAGDVKVSKDGGAQANIGTLPSYSNGSWEFTLSATEMAAKTVRVVVANTALVSADFTVETFGSASAMYPMIFSAGDAANPLTVGTGANSLNVSSGKAPATFNSTTDITPTPGTDGALAIGHAGSGTMAGVVSVYAWTRTFDGSHPTDVNVGTGDLVVDSVTGQVGSVGAMVSANVVQWQNQTTENDNNNLPLVGSVYGLILGNAVPDTAIAGVGVWSNLQMIKGQVITATGAYSFDAQTTAQGNVATLASRLTAARAGYLDNLNVGGPVASHADVLAINQSSSRTMTLACVGQFAPGATYTILMRCYNKQTGSDSDADSTPTLTATGPISGSLAANLTGPTHVGTGDYEWTYTVPASPTLEQIRFNGNSTVATVASDLSCFAQVVDQPTAVFTATNQAHLEAIYNKLPAGSLGDATAANQATIKAKTDLIATNNADSPNAVTAQGTIGTNLDAKVSSRSTLAAGAQMDLVNVPNPTAITAIQSGLATSTALASLAGKFTGITLLANWLRTLFRKDSPDATALSEINATANGIGGTWDPTLYGLQTLASRYNARGAMSGSNWIDSATALENAPSGGGGGGGGFTGTNSVTLIFHDAGGNPVPNVVFTVVGVGTGATDGTGQITIGLNSGTYMIKAVPNSGTLFANASITVSGTGSFTITGTAIVIPPASTPGQTNAYGYTRDAAGNIVGGKTIKFRLVTPPSGATDAYSEGPILATSDAATGLLQVTLAQSATYITASGVQFTTGTASTFALPAMIA